MPLRKRKKGGFYRPQLTDESEEFRVVGTHLETGELQSYGTFTTVEEAIDIAKAQDQIVCYVYGKDNRAIFSTER